MPKPIISIRNVSKRFPGVIAVDDVNVEIMENEFFALLGPSGCGKTTLLRMIAGFETPTGGEIIIDGQDMARTPPNERPVNMVFQSYAVFPHMTVADNVAYGLKVTGVERSEIDTRVKEALEMVQLDHLGARKPDQLSGGQRQRVALARALVKRPKVLLLDEPLSALDAKLRESMQLELARLQQTVGITFIIVTHDQDEALSMADRIAVMHQGAVRQLAPLEELYESPNSRFVADFIGKVNLFDGKVTGNTGNKVNVEVAGIGKIPVQSDKAMSGDIALAVRPEKIRLSKKKPTGGAVAIPGEIAAWAYYGDTSHMFIDTRDGLRISVTVQNENRDTVETADVGDSVWLSWRSEDTLPLTE
jgi:spermidine/putrescine ABC transporter ATP-binding subunit